MERKRESADPSFSKQLNEAISEKKKDASLVRSSAATGEHIREASLHKQGHCNKGPTVQDYYSASSYSKDRKRRLLMINVYLDDMRPCPKGFILVRTVEACIKLISLKKVNTLSLDHDLGFGRPSGYELVKYMVTHKIYAKKIIIHSANPFGRIRMFKLLEKHKPAQVELYIRPEPIFFKL
ncbi:hypothetical protein MJA45_13665 [Paenibacillus aurantius]|uniref:Cyclic-phosphate processing Receiver domain-containing protein n=1 Tax=Paenibacillus aurantius TaxID=2918900 RepID=A0AA96LIP9_9BACL|nr:cyclic-phosphate processing receiver domain-containing protein [Paenibacillus aurantius]WNQ14018.1 hypothetical protein MJA45_13665 [Paenibacillus aurantius]